MGMAKKGDYIIICSEKIERRCYYGVRARVKATRMHGKNRYAMAEIKGIDYGLPLSDDEFYVVR